MHTINKIVWDLYTNNYYKEILTLIVDKSWSWETNIYKDTQSKDGLND
jgi:hypothetical protein